MGKKKGSGKPFFQLHYELMRSQRFRRLSGNALRVYFWIVSQYSGYNNGNLTASYSAIRSEIGIAKDTVLKSLAELEGASFIYRTAQGTKKGEPSRFAVITPKWRIDWPRGCNAEYIRPLESLMETYQKRNGQKKVLAQKLV